MERTLHGARLELARRYAWENKLNRIVVPTPPAWLGILTTGKTYYDVRQALARAGARRRRAPALRHPHPQDGHDVPHGAAHRAASSRGASRRSSWSRRSARSSSCSPRTSSTVGRTGRASWASSTRRSARSIPIVGELDSDLIARAIAKRLARKVRIESVEARIQQLDGVDAPTPAAHAPAHGVLLLGLSAQSLDGGPRGQRGRRRHRLPRHGDGHGPRHHRRDAHGGRGRPVDRSSRRSRGRRISSRTSATARCFTRAASPSTTPWPPASTSPTRSSTTPRWR